MKKMLILFLVILSGRIVCKMIGLEWMSSILLDIMIALMPITLLVGIINVIISQKNRDRSQ